MSESRHSPVSAVWGQLPAPNRRWIILKGIGVFAVLNLVVTGAIDWGAVGGEDSVSVWASSVDKAAFFPNTVITFFLLPLIASLLVTTLVWRAVRRGVVAPVEELRSAHRWLTKLPSSRARRGVVLGTITVVLLTPLLALVLALTGASELTATQYVLWHTGLTVGLGVVVAPVIAFIAMSDPPS